MGLFPGKQISSDSNQFLFMFWCRC